MTSVRPQRAWWALEYSTPIGDRLTEVMFCYFSDAQVRAETLAIANGARGFFFRPATSAEILARIEAAKAQVHP
jgi:hypothetical protein